MNSSPPKRSPFLPWMLVAACLVAFGLAAYGGFTIRMSDSYLPPAAPATLNEGWTVITEDGARTLIIENTLPAIDCSDTVLAFLTRSEGIIARVNGQEIYRYGTESETALGRYWGSVWCMVPLDESYAGQRVSLEFIGRYSNSATDSFTFYLDERSAVVFHILVANFFLLSNCLICLMIALCLLASAAHHAILRRTDSAARLYLGTLVLLASVWGFTEMNLSQLVFHQKAVGYLLNFVSFFLLGAPFSLLLGELLPRFARRFRAFAIAFIAFFLITTAVYMAGIASPSDLLPVEHIMVALVTLDSVAVYVRQLRDKRGNPALSTGLAVFAALAFAVLVWHYVAPRARIWILSFTDLIMIGADILIVLFHMAIARQGARDAGRAQMFQRQAYTDAMTGAGNRAAFEMRMEMAANQPPEQRALFMLDLNNLKSVNDTLGHETGDQLIRCLVEVLREAFGRDGEIYRYGGDEFVVVMEGADQARATQARNALERAIDSHNRRGGCAIDTAIGLAVDTSASGTPIRKLLHEADANMYAAKQRQKKANALPHMPPRALRLQVDPLTGLMPFPAFRQRVFERLSSGSGGAYAILSFDVNHFDGYNRLFGWEAGDQLLKRMAELALALCAPDGFCAHGDADSFWAFVPFDEPEAVFRRVREQAQNFHAPWEELHLFLSFGIYAVDDVRLTVSEMCHRADLAKRSIKGRFDQLYALYDSAQHERQTLNARLLGYMQSGLAKEEFAPYYQPWFASDGVRIVGAEALVRWKHDDGTLTPPNDFIELFEKSGLLLSLDLYMFERVCHAQRKRLDRGLACPPVSVNLSRLHAYTPGGAAEFRAILDRCQLPPPNGLHGTHGNGLHQRNRAHGHLCGRTARRGLPRGDGRFRFRPILAEPTQPTQCGHHQVRPRVLAGKFFQQAGPRADRKHAAHLSAPRHKDRRRGRRAARPTRLPARTRLRRHPGRPARPGDACGSLRASARSARNVTHLRENNRFFGFWLLPFRGLSFIIKYNEGEFYYPGKRGGRTCRNGIRKAWPDRRMLSGRCCGAYRACTRPALGLTRMVRSAKFMCSLRLPAAPSR